MKMRSGLLWVLACLVASRFLTPLSAAEISGQIVISGNGPEQIAIEQLARAFEKANPRAYVDIQWDEHAKPVELVKGRQAHIAVTGKEERELRSVQIGWDGIAVMVHLSNSTKEVTSQQMADIFSGKVKTWSEVGGPDTKILVIDRPRNRNIKDAFEQHLGLTKVESGKTIGPDDKAIKAVVGTLPPLSAVTFISLNPALEAVTSGVAVRLVAVDKVEPEEPPVKDGRYKLRRPVLLLMQNDPNPIIEAFTAFALSKEGQTIIDNEGYIPLDQKKP